MSEQLNLEMGKRLKERGMDAAALDRKGALEHARAVARLLAKRHGQVSAASIARYYETFGNDLALSLGNAAGSIFKGSEWEPCGFTQSTRPARHAGMIRVWKLKEGR